MKRASIWVIIGWGSGESNASSNLSPPAQPVQTVRKLPAKQRCTHAMGESKPSTFARSWVNLQMNEYTNAASQRSRGCVAFDGGHTWPFFSVTASAAVFMMVAVEVVQQEHGRG